MRILNWNILAGGGPRVSGIAQTVEALKPDLCVLTEFRQGATGDRLSALLGEIGLVHAIPCPGPKGRNSVKLFSREPVGAVALPIDLPEATRFHVSCGRIGSLTVIATFCATPAIGKAVIRHLNEIGSLEPALSLLAIGDFFFGPRPSDPRHAEFLSPLAAGGWTDLWRMHHGDNVPWSFQGANGKSHPDHAFAFGPVRMASTGIDFHMEPLRQKLSDHAPMLAEFSLASG